MAALSLAPACGDDEAAATGPTGTGASGATSGGGQGTGATGGDAAGGDGVGGAGGDGTGGVGTGGQPPGYPDPPYGVEVGETMANLQWEGFVNDDAQGLANAQPFVDYSMNDVRLSGKEYALIHMSAVF